MHLSVLEPQRVGGADGADGGDDVYSSDSGGTMVSVLVITEVRSFGGRECGSVM